MVAYTNKEQFDNLLREYIENSSNKVIIPFSAVQIQSIYTIIEMTHSKSSIFSTKTTLDDIYLGFVKELENIPLELFTYPELINLLYNISNNLLILASSPSISSTHNNIKPRTWDKI